MPPKKASERVVGKKTKAVDVKHDELEEAHAHVEELGEKVSVKIEEMRERVKEKSLNYISAVKEELKNFDPDWLAMTLQELLKRDVMKKVKEEVGDGEEEEEENRAPSRESQVEKRETRATTALPSTMATTHRDDLMQTERRPHGDRGGRGFELRTPAGNQMRVPGLITPKIGNDTGAETRELRPDEVAFSMRGTPVVLGTVTTQRQLPNGEELLEKMSELAAADPAELTPNSRKTAEVIRAMVNQMRNE